MMSVCVCGCAVGMGVCVWSGGGGKKEGEGDCDGCDGGGACCGSCVEFLCSHETTAQCCDNSFSVRVAQLVALFSSAQ